MTAEHRNKHITAPEVPALRSGTSECNGPVVVSSWPNAEAKTFVHRL